MHILYMNFSADRRIYEGDTVAISTKPWWVVKLASIGMPCIQQVKECTRPTYGSPSSWPIPWISS